MSSKNFVQQLIGGNNTRKVKKVDRYLNDQETWQESVARVLLTGILKNQFYRSADDAAKEALPLFMDAAKKDPMFLLKAACFARNTHMKGMVKVALCAINSQASEGFLSQDIVREAAIGLLSTFHPGQLIQFVELCKSKQLGRGFGSRPQKWVRAAMESWSSNKLETYTLKYPSALNQLVRLVHPRYNNSDSDPRENLIKYVLDGRKREAKGRKQCAVEELKILPKVEGYENIVAKTVLSHDLPFDVIKGFASLKGPIAMACMTQMGLSALLLNIRSLEQHGVFNTHEGIQALRLKMDEVKHGRAIALDFAKPYIYASDQKVKDVLLDAMASTLDVPMPSIESKRVGVSIDISGSMNGEPLKTAGLMAVPFLKARDLWLTTFDTGLYEEGVSFSGRSFGSIYSIYNNERMIFCPKVKGKSPREQVRALLSLQTHGGTNCAISIDHAIRNRRKLDVHVLITDEQQNSGNSAVRESWRRYKAQVNSNAQLWIVNASNYPWTSVDYGDPSVVVYQSMTPAIFKNLEFVGENLTKAIEDFDLQSMTHRKLVR